MSGIFATEAPKYWARNLPAIPVRPELKVPAVSSWQHFAHRMPTPEEQDLWLQLYPNHNIGLPCGPASNIVVIDIDTNDERVHAIVDKMLPKSPWRRVGSKGAILAFRFNDMRTFQIQAPDESGSKMKVLLEGLSIGRQFVLPPSIHPDTRRPYTENVPLLDVVAALPVLSRDIEVILRESLRDAGFQVSSRGSTKVTTYIAAGARDNQMVGIAGLQARGVTRGERTLLEALQEMKAWVETFPEKVAGDSMSVEKAQKKVIEFLIRDVTGERRCGLPAGWDEGLTPEMKTEMGLPFTDSDEQWSVERILTYFRGELERFDDNGGPGVAQAVEVVLDRIVRNRSLNSMDEDRLLRHVSEASGKEFSRSALKTRLKELRTGDIKGETHQELAEAAYKELSLYGELRYDLGAFWQWKGAHFDRLNEHDILKHIGTHYGKDFQGARKNSDHTGIFKTLRNFAAKDLQQVKVPGVNFANGYLTEEMKLEPHKPEYGMTYVLPYRYLPEEAGRCPMFMQLLHDSWGEDPDYLEKMTALQEAMAATLIGLSPRFQRAICLIGQPHSGKSRIMEIMQGLMPEHAVSCVPPTEWGDKFMPAQMAGKLLNVAGEISENRLIAGDIFKRIVEGGLTDGQHKNQPIFQFHPKCAQWFASNVLPRTRDMSDGFNRRWLFLTFNHRVSAEKKIVDIDKIILREEREAIAAWAMEGLPRLIEQKDYTLPASHMAQIDEMATTNNSVRYFLSRNPRLRVGQMEHEGISETRTTETQLYDEYWSFCISTGTAPRVGQPKFHATMKELQHPFKFRQVVRATNQSMVQVEYEYITLAGQTRS